jgi:TP901-1 family phage major tail protein
MAKKLGRAFLIRIGDGASTETFNVLCALTAKSLSINTETIDVTTPDCTTPGGVMWRETLDGVRAVSVSGNGLIKDEASEKRANAVALASPNVANFQILVPGLGTYQGAFSLNLELGGDATGGVTYSVSLESTGVVTFTAE